MQSNAGGQHLQQIFGFGQPLTSNNSGVLSTQASLFSSSPLARPFGLNDNATSTGTSPFQNQQQFGLGGGLFSQQPQMSPFGAFGQATVNTSSGAAPAFSSTTQPAVNGQRTAPTFGGSIGYRPWLFLINGGQQSFPEEMHVREKLKQLYTLFVSSGIVEADHIVCANAYGGILCGQEDTIVNACDIGEILHGKGGTRGQFQGGGFLFGGACNTKPANRGFGGGLFGGQSNNNTCLDRVNVLQTDSVIILFIGQQHSNVSNGIPPSEFPNVGSLVFNNEQYQSTDYLNSFINDDLAPTKCLFITQSPYSAGMLQQAAKRMASKNKEFLAISPGPDHPTAEGPVLLDALIDYFTGTEWKEKTLRDLYEFIQERYHTETPYQKVYEDEIASTEEGYEEERLEAAGWTGVKFPMHQPAKIPSEMWQVFKKIDDIKEKITNSNAGNITAELQDQLTCEMKMIEESKFDLITMYKRKTNYKMHLSGSDSLRQMKMADFLLPSNS